MRKSEWRERDGGGEEWEEGTGEYVSYNAWNSYKISVCKLKAAILEPLVLWPYIVLGTRLACWYTSKN